MNGREDVSRQRRGNEPSALLSDTKPWPEERLGRRRAEANESRGMDQGDLGVEPRPAGGDLTQSLERGPDRRNERRGGRMWLARRHARLYARRRANGAERQCAGASARAAGSRIRNDAPRPPRFSAVISPPRSRMIPAEMERPSPVPLRLVV